MAGKRRSSAAPAAAAATSSSRTTKTASTPSSKRVKTSASTAAASSHKATKKATAAESSAITAEQNSAISPSQLTQKNVGRIEYTSLQTQRGRLLRDVDLTGITLQQRAYTIKKVYSERTARDLNEWRHADGAGQLFAIGSGDMAQLGLGTDDSMRERKKPTLIKALAEYDIKTIAVGALHNLALTGSGAVLSWGCNDDFAIGRLAADGADDDEHEWNPAPVDGILGKGVDATYAPAEHVEDTDSDDDESAADNAREQVIQIAAGASHSIALTATGRVYSWGTYRDANGILGYSDSMETAKQPFELKVLRHARIIQIAAGEHHDLALSADGTVYQWGDIGLGQRSSARRKLNKLTPTKVSQSHLKPTPFMVSIAAGGHTSFAIDSQGKAYALGPNNYGQCGVPITDKMKATSDYILHLLAPVVLPEAIGRIEKISCHVHHTLFLTESGKVYSVGRAEYGRLGIGQGFEAENKQHYEQLQEVDVLNSLPDDQVVDIGCGEGHSMAVTMRGQLYTWGSGELCQLGVGGEEDVYTPTLVTGQQLIGKRVLQARGGSQHTIILAAPSTKSPYAETSKAGANGTAPAPASTISAAHTNGSSSST